MGLGKPHRLAKFEVAGFIYYGNIREFDFKNRDKPKWGNPLLFGETDFTVGFADPMFPIRCATVVKLRLQQMGDFYEKPHFTMENFKFPEAVKWELKIFAPNYQKAQPYAKSGRTNRLAYVAVALFDTMRRREKKYERIAIGNSMSSITLRRYRDVVMQLFLLSTAGTGDIYVKHSFI